MSWFSRTGEYTMNAADAIVSMVRGWVTEFSAHNQQIFLSNKPLFLLYLTFPALLLLYLIQLIRRFYSPYKLPPGPWNIPIVGYLPFLDPSYPYKSLSDLAKRYGPIYALRLGSVYTVVISDAQMIKRVLAKDSTTGRAPLYVTHGIMKGYGLICAEGELWRDQRKFVKKFLRQMGAHKYGLKRDNLEKLVRVEVDDFIQYMKKLKDAIDPLEPLRHNLGSFVNQIVFGKSWPRDDKTWLWLQELQEEGLKLIGIAGPLNFLPFLRYIPYFKRTMKFLLDGKHKTHKLYRDIIDSRNISNIDKDNITNLLDAFLLEREMRKGSEDLDKYYNYDQFYHLLADIFGAALDTTLTTLRWYFLYMANNPIEQALIHNEIDYICGTGPLSLAHLVNLPRLEASIMETQRIRTVVPLGIPHGTTTNETVIESFRLPVGTMIVPLQWEVHMGSNWEQPERFDPARFLTDDGRNVKRNSENFIPFQIGKRMCVGDELAKIMLVLFAGGVMQNFDVKLAKTEVADLIGECGITLAPKPCKLVLSCRGETKCQSSQL